MSSMAASVDPKLRGSRLDADHPLNGVLIPCRFTVLPFDEDAAGHYGEIRADLERRGSIIGPYDLMIAAHARSRGLIVVTGNLGEFRRVDGLRSEDWLIDA